MKNIALHSIHEKLGAKMVPFAGYNMPVQYEGVTAEHLTVRAAVGVFDVSHMGEFLVRRVCQSICFKRWFSMCVQSIFPLKEMITMCTFVFRCVM